MKLAQSLSALLLLGATSITASAVGFTNVVNAPIPDGNPNGVFSTIDISGVSGTISNVSVYLKVSGQWNGDLYGYLSCDNGGFAVLLNRPGKSSTDPIGYADSGFNIVLDDHAATDLHLYGGASGNPLTGTWQPDGRQTDPQLTVDTDPRTALLNSFNGFSPNGTWTLFLADMAVGYNNDFVSWGLNIDSVPEPSATALFLCGLGCTILLRRHRR